MVVHGHSQVYLVLRSFSFFFLFLNLLYMYTHAVVSLKKNFTFTHFLIMKHYETVSVHCEVDVQDCLTGEWMDSDQLLG